MVFLFIVFFVLCCEMLLEGFQSIAISFPNLPAVSGSSSSLCAFQCEIIWSLVYNNSKLEKMKVFDLSYSIHPTMETCRWCNPVKLLKLAGRTWRVDANK